MAEPTPWQLASKKAPTYRKTRVYVTDPYNFSHVSVSHGTNPVEVIPPSGIYSAGAPVALRNQQVLRVDVVAYGTNQAIMGSNLHSPAV